MKEADLGWVAPLLLAKLTQMSGGRLVDVRLGSAEAVACCSPTFSCFRLSLAGACNNRDMREKTSYTRAFQAFGNNTLANIPLANASHMLKPKAKG